MYIEALQAHGQRLVDGFDVEMAGAAVEARHIAEGLAVDEKRMREHLEHETELEADAPEKAMPA